MANLRQLLLSVLSGLFFWVQPLSAQNWAAQSAPYGRPDATIDLRTKEGTQLARGTWRYSDVKIVEVDSKGPGPDLKPSGAPIRTYDYEPHAGTADFDDSKWQVLDPTTLDARRAGGKVCFNWRRQPHSVSCRTNRTLSHSLEYRGHTDAGPASRCRKVIPETARKRGERSWPRHKND